MRISGPIFTSNGVAADRCGSLRHDGPSSAPKFVNTTAPPPQLSPLRSRSAADMHVDATLLRPPIASIAATPLGSCVAADEAGGEAAFFTCQAARMRMNLVRRLRAQLCGLRSWSNGGHTLSTAARSSERAAVAASCPASPFPPAPAPCAAPAFPTAASVISGWLWLPSFCLLFITAATSPREWSK